MFLWNLALRRKYKEPKKSNEGASESDVPSFDFFNEETEELKDSKEISCMVLKAIYSGPNSFQSATMIMQKDGNFEDYYYLCD